MAKGIILTGKQGGGQFFWTVDKDVGPASPNLVEDVQLVQLGFSALAASPNVSKQENAVFTAVLVGKVYSGGASDPLTIAIRLLLKQLGGTQDGKISSIKSGTGLYDKVPHTWAVRILSIRISEVLGTNWPHLDRHPQCPDKLATVSKRTFGRESGTGAGFCCDPSKIDCHADDRLKAITRSIETLMAQAVHRRTNSGAPPARRTPFLAVLVKSSTF